MNVIESENHWRVSHSGYSIKCGWSDNARIVCQYPGSSAPGKLDGARFEQWLKDAEHICELHNAALTPPPVVEVTDETAYELHQALHNARSECIRKTADPLPWYWDMAAWIYAVQQVLGPTLGLVTREKLARTVGRYERAILWMFNACGFDGVEVCGEMRDIHDEALEWANARGAEEASWQDYVETLLTFSDEQENFDLGSELARKALGNKE